MAANYYSCVFITYSVHEQCHEPAQKKGNQGKRSRNHYPNRALVIFWLICFWVFPFSIYWVLFLSLFIGFWWYWKFWVLLQFKTKILVYCSLKGCWRCLWRGRGCQQQCGRAWRGHEQRRSKGCWGVSDDNGFFFFNFF